MSEAWITVKLEGDAWVARCGGLEARAPIRHAGIWNDPGRYDALKALRERAPWLAKTRWKLLD